MEQREKERERDAGLATSCEEVSGKQQEKTGAAQTRGGDELVNRSYRDRAADDLGHRDVTRNLSREL